MFCGIIALTQREIWNQRERVRDGNRELEGKDVVEAKALDRVQPQECVTMLAEGSGEDSHLVQHPASEQRPIGVRLLAKDRASSFRVQLVIR